MPHPLGKNIGPWADCNYIVLVKTQSSPMQSRDHLAAQFMKKYAINFTHVFAFGGWWGSGTTYSWCNSQTRTWAAKERGEGCFGLIAISLYIRWKDTVVYTACRLSNMQWLISIWQVLAKEHIKSACMAVSFSSISGRVYPAWQPAFQAFLEESILHGSQLFKHLWKKSWMLLGWYLDVTWMILGCYLDDSWMSLGWYLDVTWMLLGFYLGDSWMLLGWYLDVTWMFLAWKLDITLILLGCYLGGTGMMLGCFLDAAWMLLE